MRRKKSRGRCTGAFALTGAIALDWLRLPPLAPGDDRAPDTVLLEAEANKFAGQMAVCYNGRGVGV